MLSFDCVHVGSALCHPLYKTYPYSERYTGGRGVYLNYTQ